MKAHAQCSPDRYIRSYIKMAATDSSEHEIESASGKRQLFDVHVYPLYTRGIINCD